MIFSLHFVERTGAWLYFCSYIIIYNCLLLFHMPPIFRHTYVCITIGIIFWLYFIQIKITPQQTIEQGMYKFYT